MEKRARDQENPIRKKNGKEHDIKRGRSLLAKRPKLSGGDEVENTISADDQLKYSHKAKQIQRQRQPKLKKLQQQKKSQKQVEIEKDLRASADQRKFQ